MNLEQLLVNSPWIVFLVILWVLPWKAIALWRAARNNSKGWFIALLLLNTLGVLEIFYIFVFGKKTETVVKS